MNGFTPLASACSRTGLGEPDRPRLGRHRQIPRNYLIHLPVAADAPIKQVQESESGNSDQSVNEVLADVRNRLRMEHPSQKFKNLLQHSQQLPGYPSLDAIDSAWTLDIAKLWPCQYGVPRF